MNVHPATLALLALVSIDLLLALAVAVDARRSAVDDPGNWVVLVAFTGPIGLLLYASERGTPEQSARDGEFTLAGQSPGDRQTDDE